MSPWNHIRKILKNACVYFTALSVFIILARLLTGDASSAGVIYTISFLMLFPFGIAMALAQEILVSRLARWIRYLSHFAITAIAAILFLWLPSGVTPTPATGLVLLVLFTVLYWVIFGLSLLVYTRVKRLLEED